eukprot:NODE_2301_length_1237_cov_25.957071_g2097_i0.p1 GENE.NODE_2301_length_1237_cov_25.957071_g2097_i0~~NODE_2301_length_1237_cov_25.957071_g2097_i0.p1  ORF type:complete len:318 (+),score=65.12 NODE_2301_length_1237_cov_25.957071_g2097_i0:124-1077(+)
MVDYTRWNNIQVDDDSREVQKQTLHGLLLHSATIRKINDETIRWEIRNLQKIMELCKTSDSTLTAQVAGPKNRGTRCLVLKVHPGLAFSVSDAACNIPTFQLRMFSGPVCILDVLVPSRDPNQNNLGVQATHPSDKPHPLHGVEHLVMLLEFAKQGPGDRQKKRELSPEVQKQAAVSMILVVALCLYHAGTPPSAPAAEWKSLTRPQKIERLREESSNLAARSEFRLARIEGNLKQLAETCGGRKDSAPRKTNDKEETPLGQLRQCLKASLFQLDALEKQHDALKHTIQQQSKDIHSVRQLFIRQHHDIQSRLSQLK